MVSLKMKKKAERRLRELLSEGGFSQPEEVRYGPNSVALLWHSADKAIVVDTNDHGEVGESRIGPSPRSPESCAGFSQAEPPSALQWHALELKAAEQHARTKLDEQGVRQPDEIEYGQTCIRLLWHEEKVAMVVELAQTASE